MKKFILFSVAAIFSLSCQAISLFPYFTDIAGDYEDGTHDKFVSLNLPTIVYRMTPFWYKNIKDADDFLKDTLPFSNYVIIRDEKVLEDKTVVITYTTSLEADGLYKDKWSTLILVQTPGEPLFVGLGEDQL